MNLSDPIGNRFSDFTLENLCELVNQVKGRGPFLLTQEGAHPGDPHYHGCKFVLSRRGSWLHYFLYLELPQDIQERCFQFETVSEAFRLAESLPPKPVVEDSFTLAVYVRECGFVLPELKVPERMRDLWLAPSDGTRARGLLDGSADGESV